MQEYSLGDLGRLFKLTATLLRSLARAGYLTPAHAEGLTSYNFHDLLILRMASALKAADITDTKIVAAIRNIRATLPPGSALATLALAGSNKSSILREGIPEWPAQSTQNESTRQQMDGIRVTAVRKRAAPPRILEAEAHYARGHALEESDMAAARAAYLDALNAHSEHLEARINLGRLLHLNGELKQAEKVYRQAKTSSALLSFNLGILLEDLNREEDAIRAYREALAQDPHLHDAHFNLSRLHERAQQPREALRHLLAYRRHVLAVAR